MTFAVKIRVEGGEWIVFQDVPAVSFLDAEKRAKRQLAREMGLPENKFEARAYRTDAKSVWRAL